MYIATKTIDWALNPPLNDRLFLRDGEEVKGLDDDVLAERLLGLKYIKHVVEVDENKEPHGANFVSGPVMTGFETREDLSTEKVLEKVIAGIKKNDDKKDALEAWGKENAKVDIDRRKSVKNIIKELVEIVG